MINLTVTLPNIFDTLYDIKTKSQLEVELEYLTSRISGLIDLSNDHLIFYGKITLKKVDNYLWIIVNEEDI